MLPYTTRRQFLQAVATNTTLLWPGVGSFANSQQDKLDLLSGLDDYIEQAMERWDVPGLAIAVVQGSKPIHVRGYGVRRAGDKPKVDSETLFNIASCSKAFTASAVARLVDQQKVDWDDPIVKHLPSLRLFTPELTEKVTIRHALAHRTGLPNANMLWRNGAFNSDEILARLRWLEPISTPGEQFLYTNNMYLVIGKLVEQVSGKTWSDFLQSELFEPLGMKSSTADREGIEGRTNVATPHASDDGRLRPIEPYCPDMIAPAGAIHSNLNDLVQWLKMNLAGGVCDGRRVLSQARLEEMHTAFGRSDSETPPKLGVPRSPIAEYGLGWFINEYEGQRVIEHSGSTNGLIAWMATLPQQRLGLAILSNHHRTGLNYALRFRIFDAVLNRPSKDWSEVVRQDYTNGFHRLIREAKAEFDAKRPVAKSPPRALAEYVGKYESKLYGIGGDHLGRNSATPSIRVSL